MHNIWDWLFKSSIRRQLIIGVALVHLVLMTILVLDLVRRQKVFLKERSLQEAKNLSEMLANSSGVWVMADDVAGLQEVVSQFSLAKNINYVMIVAPDGRVLGHTDRSKVGLFLSDSTSIVLLNSSTQPHIIFESENYIETAHPILFNYSLIGWARVSKNFLEEQSHLQYANREGFFFTVSAIIIGALFAIFLSRKILKQLNLLLTGAHRLKTHQLDNPIPITTKNEVGVVSEAFNTAMNQLRESEKELLESTEKFRSLTENTVDWIWEVNRDGVYTYSNPNSKLILGYDPDEIIGKTPFDFMPKEESEKQSEIFLEVISKKEPIKFLENVNLHKNGSPVILETNAIPIINTNGEFQGYRGIDRDITERKRAELLIKKLSEAVSQSPASIIITDPHGNIEYVNKTFEHNTGYKLQEVYQQHTRILRSGHTAREVYKELWDTILSGKTWRGELLNKMKNGELCWQSALISPIIDKNGSTINFLAVEQDITEKKKMIEELITAKERAETSEQIKSEFLAQMSHEIRTPLNIIMNNTDFIKDEFASIMTNELSALFQGVDISAKRVIRTVDLILNMSELQAGSFIPYFTTVEIENEIFKPLVKEYTSLAALRGIELKYFSSLHTTSIYADRYCLTHIFANLLDNAVKYTTAGAVTVSVINNSSGRIMVEVKDTGIGMSKDFLAHVFEPFVQEEHGYSRKFEGNGLGLALVKKYCEINHASIEVESEKNVGSTFRVVFNS